MEPWGFPDDSLWRIPLSALGIYAAIIIMSRVNGLRSFSSMSGFDFAMTIATGSIIASTLLNPRPTLIEGAFGLLVLFALQRLVAISRRNPRLARLVDNEPLMLILHGRMLGSNMQKARMTEHDVYSKLRENGVASMDDVQLMVLETTGTISIVREGPIDPRLLDGVRKGSGHD